MILWFERYYFVVISYPQWPIILRRDPRIFQLIKSSFCWLFFLVGVFQGKYMSNVTVISFVFLSHNQLGYQCFFSKKFCKLFVTRNRVWDRIKKNILIARKVGTGLVANHILGQSLHWLYIHLSSFIPHIFFSLSSKFVIFSLTLKPYFLFRHSHRHQ